MSRIRSIKPEFARHYELYQTEKETGLPLRAAFPCFWMVADREGRFKWQPEVLKLDILPFDPIDFNLVLEALEKIDLIRSYTVNGKKYGYIPTFLKHQVVNIREQKSILPAPPCESTEQVQETHVHAHDLYCGEGEGEEEGKGSVLANTFACAPENCEIQKSEPEPQKQQSNEKQTDCPVVKIVELYHANCPMLPKVVSWNGTGKKSMVQRWREDKSRQSLEWWEQYFFRVSASDFLTGQIKDFSANLNWLVGTQNMEKIINGAYDNRSSPVIPDRLKNNIRAGIEFLQGG